jgi:hypothetical protein
LFFVSFGLGVERIGILKAVYPGDVGHSPNRHRPAKRPLGPQRTDRHGHVGAIGRSVPYRAHPLI